ncbi:MAG: hypothetical protein HYT87_11165 [Nitrospirae bacterium]|nr:hypothetical protein [Nitrospirota bacterium]
MIPPPATDSERGAFAPVAGGGMTADSFTLISRRFQRTHALGLAATVLGTVALSTDAAFSLLCGGALGAFFFWALLRAAYPLFVAPSESTRRRVMVARALILVKPLVFFGIVWACMRGLRLEPLSFAAGFLTLPASLTVAACLYGRKVQE